MSERVFAFDAALELGSYELPSDAHVFVEAYRQTSWMRFAFGTAGAIAAPADRRLIEFDSPEGVLFRVRVTSSKPAGLLLAEADRIRPRRTDIEDTDRLPLLPARPAPGLDAEIFRVDFDDEPILLINERVGDWHALTQDRTFQALVLPALLRQILIRILHVERYTETDDPDDWRAQWLRLAATYPGVSMLPRDDESERFDDWIDEAVAAFAHKHETLERFARYWSGEADR